MESFFDLCDKDPTSYETHCNAGGKNEIWDLYVVEKKNQNANYLEYNDFLDLWNSLFPRVTCRDFKNIPGKCQICWEIDRKRRTNSDRLIQLRLKEAHCMHRGGFFMLERQE